jgi:outer membrane protein OmpA-like peptidoglycan-associated protein
MVLMGWVPGAFASGTTGAEFLQIHVPAAAAAQAAGAADKGGLKSLAWNPAGLLGAEYPELAVTHFSSLADTAYEQIEGVYPGVFQGNVGLRLFYSGNYNLMEVDESGNDAGHLQNFNLLGQVAYAHTLFGDWEGGAALKVFQSSLAGFDSRGAAVDVGIRRELKIIPLALGAGIMNLGRMSAFDQDADPLPTLAIAGIEVLSSVWNQQHLKLTADWNWSLAGDEAGYGTLGAEYAFRELACIRAGYRLNNELGALSVGGGLQWAGLGLDYVFQPFGTLGSNHRLTISYYFKPLATQAVSLPPQSASAISLIQSAAVSKPIDGTPVEKVFESQPALKPFKVETRDLEGQVIFRALPDGSAGAILGIRIVDAQGRLIQTLPEVNAGTEWVWDGRDEAGKRLPENMAFYFCAQTAEGEGEKLPLPQVASVLRLSMADQNPVYARMVFRIMHRPPVEAWSLSIMDKDSQASIRHYSCQGSLPAEWIWDGKNQSGKLAPKENRYEYRLSVKMKLGLEIISGQEIHRVEAQAYRSLDGKENLMIPGVLFDFNSAVLKAEMMDKITMAADVLRNAGTAARVVCEGHADEIGSATDNQRISEQRAAMVAQFLHDHYGMNSWQLSIRGYGKTRPIDTRGTEEARARNRRVEIRVLLPLSAR